MSFDLSKENNRRIKVGDRVRTRGDFGGFNLVVTKVHNNHFCECKGYGKLRHFNMNVLELIKPTTQQSLDGGENK